MTGCLTCIQETRQGFQGYDRAELIGIFTCECPGDHLADYAKILESKGADAIHLQYLGQFFNPLAAETVYNARLAGVFLDVLLAGD